MNVASVLMSLALALMAAAHDPTAEETCPMHAQHMKEREAATGAHVHGVDVRGDAAMGFSHEATTHHFRLRADGGAIEVTADDAGDEASVAQIRAHLRVVAKAFADGDFALPGVIHDQVPPGAEAMKAHRGAIRYVYDDRAQGAVVSMTTEDAAALRAIHEFLRFQISEHRTGDPLVP